MRSLGTTTLVYPPGTHTKYSNAGITVVGAVVERVRGEPFAASLQRTLIGPLGLSRTSFNPGPELGREQAEGLMWTYDGQKVATPTFLLGTGPAGNLVSTVADLGRFLSVLFADGRGPEGAIVGPETLRSDARAPVWCGQRVEGVRTRFRWLSTFEGRRRVGHGGAVYGYATELSALPDEKLGVAVIATKDCAPNAIVRHISDARSLRLMLAARQGQPLPAARDHETGPARPRTPASKGGISTSRKTRSSTSSRARASCG